MMVVSRHKPPTIEQYRDAQNRKNECDPHGKNQHEPGAKLDAGKVRLGLVLSDFSHALVEIGKVGTYGAEKYTPHGWLDVPDGIERYKDALFMRLLAADEIDIDTGLLHMAHAAWNCLAVLELMLIDRMVNGD